MSTRNCATLPLVAAQSSRRLRKPTIFRPASSQTVSSSSLTRVFPLPEVLFQPSLFGKGASAETKVDINICNKLYANVESSMKRVAQGRVRLCLGPHKLPGYPGDLLTGGELRSDLLVDAKPGLGHDGGTIQSGRERGEGLG